MVLILDDHDNRQRSSDSFLFFSPMRPKALEEDSKIHMALIAPQILDEKGHWIDCRLHQHLSIRELVYPGTARTQSLLQWGGASILVCSTQHFGEQISYNM